MKTKRLVSLILCLFLLTLSSACGSEPDAPETTTEAAVEESTTAETVAEEPTSEPTTEPLAPEADWQDFVLTLNGATLSLPCALDEFVEKTGFHYDEVRNAENEMDWKLYTDGKCIVKIFDQSSKVSGLTLWMEGFEENPTAFSLPGGLTFGSSYDEAVKVYGPAKEPGSSVWGYNVLGSGMPGMVLQYNDAGLWAVEFWPYGRSDAGA